MKLLTVLLILLPCLCQAQANPPGRVLDENGNPTMFHQELSNVIDCIDPVDPTNTEVRLRIHGSVSGASRHYPFTIKSLEDGHHNDNHEGSQLRLHSNFVISNGGGDFHKSGCIDLITTLFRGYDPDNSDEFFEPSNSAAYIGDALRVEQYNNAGREESDNFYQLFKITKTGDIYLGQDKRSYFHSGTSPDEINRDLGGSNQWKAGTRLFFSGDHSETQAADNTDPIFIHRFNEAQDKSTLRVSLSDDGVGPEGGQADIMEVGFYDHAQMIWHPGIALYASGDIYARLVRVTTGNYPDYVFKPDYKLASLYEVDEHIKTNGHLPGLKPAAVVEKEGMDLGEQTRLLVEKIEELTLHLIRIQKELDTLKAGR